jgi:DNA-binding LacI/PurR family transcriptional regulator
MSTIKDVAKLAHGVSLASVSRVIYNKEICQRTTKQLVLDAIDRLVDVPNEWRGRFSASNRESSASFPHLTSYYFGICWK